MKNREKFLLIFMITTIILTILIVIKGNIEFNELSKEQEVVWQELEKGEKEGKYSLEIEEGIKEHMAGISELTEREQALSSYISSVNIEYLLEYTGINARLIEVINLIFHSLSITLFIYCMLTVEYKNKKQYVLANIGVFGMLLVLQFINNILGIGDTVLFYENGGYNIIEILPLLYLVFLTGNAIKNKRKLQIFNVTILALVAIANAIYSSITWYFDITWDLVYGIYLVLLAIEGIILFARNQINKKQKVKEINKAEIKKQNEQ